MYKRSSANFYKMNEETNSGWKERLRALSALKRHLFMIIVKVMSLSDGLCAEVNGLSDAAWAEGTAVFWQVYPLGLIGMPAWVNYDVNGIEPLVCPDCENPVVFTETPHYTQFLIDHLAQQHSPGLLASIDATASGSTDNGGSGSSGVGSGGAGSGVAGGGSCSVSVPQVSNDGKHLAIHLVNTLTSVGMVSFEAQIVAAMDRVDKVSLPVVLLLLS